MPSKKWPVLRLDGETCRNLDEALGREWLETNGIGGFASSSIAGANTRRYHGLLVAATRPPVGRMVLLSKFEETLLVKGERFELATNEYPGAVHPQGLRYLTSFRLDPFPVCTFECGGITLEKSIFMVHGSNTTCVEYRITSGEAATVRLELRPLIAYRDYHALTHENGSINHALENLPGLVRMTPYQDTPALHLAHNARSIDANGYWYRDFIYRVERERGLDDREDLFSPCALHFDLARDPAQVIASLEQAQVTEFAMLRQREVARRAAIVKKAPVKDPFVQSLALAADQYLVRRGEGATVIAGYPWFTDWGRDTMIALPGLTLFTGNESACRSILLEFAKHVDQGMLPNRFPDSGETAEFNTVDATLWFFEAVRAYVTRTGDFALVREHLYSVLTGIVDWHIRGTRYNIKVTDAGLLNSGAPGAQLTWMDAKIGDWVVTPRSGKPVEIQALWYNALRIMEDFAQRMGDADAKRRYAHAATLLQWTFNRVFWNPEAGCLYDVVNGTADASIRPNQLLAISLPHSMVPADRARSILEVVERELLTPYGLRTLPRSDSRYAARYEGGPQQRDAVYHQGTVWPWLMGPYISALIKVRGNSETTRKQGLALLEPLRRHLAEAGLNHVSEIFDADAPHTPRGCFAQAWSVAEILRVLCEEIYEVKTSEVARAAAASA